MSENTNQDHIARLKRAAATIDRANARIAELEQGANEPVAVIGMACRFPAGADDPQALWRVLRDGIDAVREAPVARWGRSAPHPSSGTRWAATLDEIADFDAEFFGISPREAQRLDPQQRLLLEVSWEALEFAAIAAGRLAATRTGVFVGITTLDYQQRVLDQALDIHSVTGTALCFAAGRLAHTLGLQGPCMVFDTACSSALVAVHQAVQSLRSGESEMALVGGVNLICSPTTTQMLAQALSPTGRCMSFDARANGYVRGEGCGVVVLKKQSLAERDGDRILALIRGSAVNHDGRSTGLTAPNMPSQQRLLRQALANARVHPEQIGYVETHGTGTPLGDPIEVEALRAVLGAARADGSRCRLGAIKTNLGHLEAAAGIAALIKTVLVLDQQAIPKNLHFDALNPMISLAGTSFEIPTSTIPWPRGTEPRRAGVSSFGMSGTNAHVVLEEAPRLAERVQSGEREEQLLVLSGRTPEALRGQVERQVAHLKKSEDGFADICHTAGIGRNRFEQRVALVARDAQGAVEALEAYLSGAGSPKLVRGRGAGRPKIGFLFTGQGSQYAGMGQGLYASEPVFREALERCAKTLDAVLPRRMLEVLYPASDTSAQGLLDQTEYTQPLLVALEWSLVQLWRSWGIEPDCVMGHSVGEYTAAVVAGVLTLEDGLRLVASRGRRMQSLNECGVMASVRADAALVEKLLAEEGRGEVSIAAYNGPAHVVISGSEGGVSAVLERLSQQGVAARRLVVSHAFHSGLMEPMLEGLREDVSRVQLQEPQLPLVSNLTGELASDELTSAEYWVKHTRSPVAFERGMATLRSSGCDVFLELGPQPTLVGLGRACEPAGEGPAFLPSMRHGESEHSVLLHTLGELYVRGASVDFGGLDRPYPRRRVALPTYAWQRQRHWIDGTAGEQEAPESLAARGSEAAAVEHVAPQPLLEGPANGAEQTLRFELLLDVQRQPYLADHRVFDRVIVPGAHHAAALLALAEKLSDEANSAPLVLDDLVLPQALVLERETTLEVILNPTDPGSFDARVSARLGMGPDASWRTHAMARLRAAAPDAEDVRPSLAEVQGRLQVTAEAASEAYTTLAQSGLGFGPAFRTLAQLARAPGESLARLEVSSWIGEHSAEPLHPCILDACFQTFGAALPLERDLVYLPFSFERLRLFERPHGSLWCHARLRVTPADGLTWLGDITLFDTSGHRVAEIDGYRARAMTRTQLLQEKGDSRGPLYSLAWRPVQQSSTPSTRRRRWLLLVDQSGIGRELSQQLAAAGEECVEVLAGEEFEQREAGTFVLNPARRSDLTRLLAAVGDVDGVVHLWALDDTGIDVRRGSGGALHLIQALVEAAPSKPPRLWLVTRGAQSTGSGASAPAQAVLWGLGRVLALEHPELASVLLDLDLDDASPARTLHQELMQSETEGELLWRGKQRLGARLLPATLAVGPNVAIHEHAVYLITGGWGALGLHVAGWLADRGARHLVLAGRRAPTPSDRASGTIRALVDRGVEVRLIEADLAQAAEVARLLRACNEGSTQLRGLIHAAGVLDDGLLRDLSFERMLAVLMPKLAGATHLELALEAHGQKLDFFVLFSSISALIGSPGQGSYAAANAFLDAFAHHRQARGLTGVSIGWGPWLGDGMASGETLQRRFLSRGVESIEPKQGLELLDRVLASGDRHVLAMPGTWTQTADSEPLRRLLSEIARPRTQPSPSRQRSKTLRGAEILAETRRLAGTVLGMRDPSELDDTRPLAELGLDSLMAVELRDALAKALGLPLPATLVFDHPSVTALAKHLGQLLDPAPAPEAPQITSPAPADDSPIAIVGLACRFPGSANDLESYWALLTQGTDAIGEVPADRWDAAAFYDPDPEAPGKMYTRWGGFVDDVAGFDAKFFGITPREAASMDPQQRILLEVTWEALEHAGIAPDTLAGSRGGVFTGIMFNDYAQRISSQPAQIDAWFGTGNATSVASGRVSYQLGLKGPSITIDTACSSSLVALHLACQSLRAGEADMALAGGATVMLSPAGNIYFSRARALAADGRCKSFAAAADGVVWSEGCGVLVLKCLADALAAGDPIRAVIRGTAVNQDGRSNGLSAPNGPSQVAVIEQALRQGGVLPEDIDYVEAHGTGTPLGDPVEAQALNAAFGKRPEHRPLLVGSVKSNFGHTQAAAGVAGVIKTVLALEHQAIPPTLHAQPPSEHVDWSRLKLVSTAQLWPAGQRSRRAGVSSFGISGTNAHVVLEEAPRLAERVQSGEREEQLLVLSGRTPEALRGQVERQVAHLKKSEDGFADICHTAGIGRNRFEQRVALVARDAQGAVEALEAYLSGAGSPKLVRGRGAGRPKIGFLFTGQGSQYAGMGQGLYASEPVFREALERCAKTLDAVLPRRMLEVLYPASDTSAQGLLDQTEYTQPLLVALEWSLVQLWRSWGIEPDCVMGHSVGEYTAAVVAGVLTLEDGLRLVASRGRRMQSLNECGVMASVRADAALVEKLLAEEGRGEVSIAAYNGPAHVVISGSEGGVSAVLERLSQQGVAARRLVVSHAFHSGLMEPMLEGLREDVSRVQLQEPQLPLVSNLTGELASDELTSAEYWVKHTRSPVAFERGMATLRSSGCDVFLELGPQPTLVGLGRACEPAGEGPAFLPSMRHGESEHSVLLHTLGELYVRGASVDFGGLDRPYPRRRVALPTYAWQRQRHWIDGGTAAPLTALPAGKHPLLGTRIRLAHQPDTELWQAQLDPGRLAYVADHRVEGELVMPGTAYLEMVLAAAAELGLEGARQLLGVRNHQTMVFSNGQPRLTQLALTRSHDATLEFRISSRPEASDADADAARWVLHCSGRLGSVPSEQVAPEPLSALRARCLQEISGGEFYERLRERGNDWGPAFQGIQRLWCGPGEVLAEIQAPAEIAAQLSSYEFHPALSDACGHAFAALQAFNGTADALAGAFVGAGAEEARVYARPAGKALWAHARLRSADGDSPLNEPNLLIADIRILDESEGLVAELLGARFWYLDAAFPERSAVPVNDWLYELAWEPQSLREVPSSASRAPGSWFVLADDSGMGDALAAELKSRGEICVRVTAASDAQGFALLDSHHVQVRPERVEDFQRMFGLIESQRLPPCRGVVCLWSLNAPSSDDLSPAALASAIDLVTGLHLVQASLATELPVLPALWLVTRSSQAVMAGDPIAVAGAPIWGLGGVISQEHPELWGGLVDLGADPSGVRPRAGDVQVTQLAAELLGEPTVEQVALRGDQRFVARLARWRGPVTDSALPRAWRTDASYLVTGGLGELGLIVARWMVEQGARHLILAGRTALPPRAEWAAIAAGSAPAAAPRLQATIAAIRELESSGASVLVATLDVSDERDLAGFLEAYAREGRPTIRGVIHAAGVVSPGPLGELDAEKLRAVLQAKTVGSWLLHRHFTSVPLDFFVLFSSAASLLPSPLLGAYPAANAFLDALAHHRRAQGLPAISINWGPWAEAGMAAQRSASERSSTLGDMIPVQKGLEVLDRLLRQAPVRVGVLPMHWAAWARAHGDAAAIPFYSRVLDEVASSLPSLAAGEQQGRAGAPLLQPIDPTSPQLPQLILERLRILVARIAGLQADEVDVAMPLSGLGLDSLMAVEVRRAVQRDLGVTLPLVQFLSAVSIGALCASLCEAIATKRSKAETMSVEWEEGEL